MASARRSRIFVRFNSNRNIPVQVDPQWNVSKLKEEIGRQQAVDPRDIRIIFAGRELKDDMKLKVLSQYKFPLVISFFFLFLFCFVEQIILLKKTLSSPIWWCICHLKGIQFGNPISLTSLSYFSSLNKMWFASRQLIFHFKNLLKPFKKYSDMTY